MAAVVASRVLFALRHIGLHAACTSSPASHVASIPVIAYQPGQGSRSDFELLYIAQPARLVVCLAHLILKEAHFGLAYLGMGTEPLAARE